MKTFIISTSFTGCCEYTIHADTKEQAQELFDDGVWISCADRNSRVENNEEIFEIEEVK